MAIKLSKRSEDINYELENSDGMSEIFADGISNLLMGKYVSKVVFHTDSISNVGKSPKLRKAVLTLIMSTPGLIHMCKQVLESAKESLDEFSQDEVDIKVKNLLDGITFLPTEE